MSSISSRRRRAREALDVRALAVAILELGLGLVGLVPLVGVAFFGEPEVDERAVPGVPEGHIGWNLALCGPSPASLRASAALSGRGASRSGRSWRPPRRRSRSPGSCPSRAARGPRSAASSRSAANHGRLSSGSLGERRHRHQADDRHGQRARNASSSAGATPLLASSPAMFTSTSTSVSRRRVALELREHRVAGDGVDPAHVREHLADLAALQVADEVEREPVAPALLLGDEVLGAVLAGERDARVGEHARPRRAGRTSPPRGSRRRPGRARRGRTRPRSRRGPPRGSRARAPASRPWISSAMRLLPACPARAPSRRWDQSSPAGAHIVHRPVSWISVTSSASRMARATAARSACAPPAHARAEVGERGVDLVAGLVAADPRARARSPRATCVAPRSRSARTPSCRTPAARPRQPAWTAPTASGAIRTTGRQSATRTVHATSAQRRWPARRPPGAGAASVSASRTTRTCAPCTCGLCATRAGGQPDGSPRAPPPPRLAAGRSSRRPRSAAAS